MLFIRIVVVAALTLGFGQLSLAAPPQAPPSLENRSRASARQAASPSADAAIVAAVKKTLSNQSDLRRLAVTVSGSEVTLTGRLPNLWLKQDAIKRTLKVAGVKTVVSDIELPRLESDQDLALYLGRAIDAYPHYTMFDYIDAVIRNGVITLTGSVTSERNKVQEIADEVARVRGVQEIRNEIVMQPPSQGDDRIRAALFDRILSSIHFDHLTGVNNTPFHVVVQNGVVSLYGFVQTEIEYRELESIARFTGGVLRVQNNLKTLTKPKR